MEVDKNKKGTAVQEFIDSIPFSATQRLLLILCFLVILVDGFDTASIGFIAPALKADWGLSASHLAPLFVSGLIGLTGGAVFIGPLADRIGRKKILIISVLTFGLACLASAFSPDLTTLVILRFITGLGLGSAMPSVITLMSEYSPSHRRSTFVTLMFCGFTIGSALGGIVSAQIIKHVHWSGILLIGGLAALILLPFLIFFMPESLRFKVLKKHNRQSIDKIIGRLTSNTGELPSLVAGVEEKSKSSIRDLFSNHYALNTLLIWATYFMSLLIIYLISNWLPTLLTSTGASLEKASLVTSVFQIGGTIGSVTLGYLMDKSGGDKVLSLAYALGALFIILCGFSSVGLTVLVIGIFGVGIFVSGSQTGLNAYSAGFYPTHCRATGVSWANAMGRCGSVIGSVIGGWLMGMNLSMQAILSLLTMPALIAAACLLILRIRSRKTGPAHNIHDTVAAA